MMFSKFRRKDDSEVINPTILTTPNPTSPHSNVHLESRLRSDTPNDLIGVSNIDKNNIQDKICLWLQLHNVWFGDKIGNKLASILIESGITDPLDLKLLKEWPDLIQIADASDLNIIQRRKFINAIHDPMSGINTNNDYTTNKLKEEHIHYPDNDRERDNIDNIHHLPLGFFIPGPKDYYNRYNISGTKSVNNNTDVNTIDIDINKFREERDNEIKHILVMSDKEQEALARMDSIISQLHITRNLIRRRCEALDSGAIECENIIRKEFNILRELINNREEYIIGDLHKKKNKRIEQLNTIDIDIDKALISCHKAKYKVECIIENDTQYSGSSWSVLISRASRAVKSIENTIEFQVAKNDFFDENNKPKRYSISSLIHTDMDIDNLLAFETFGTAENIDVGMTKVKDWNTLQNTLQIDEQPFKDVIFKNLKKLHQIEQEAIQKHGFGENSYATHDLNVFIRSPSQIFIRSQLPGFSFQRNQKRIHQMIRKYGIISDVEKSVDSQVNQLFKSVAKIPQHSLSSINVIIDKAYFVNEITKEFDDQTEIYQFDNHRSLSVEVTVKPNPENSVKAAQIINKQYKSDNDNHDVYFNNSNKKSPVVIYRIFEVELQICRQPILSLSNNNTNNNNNNNNNEYEYDSYQSDDDDYNYNLNLNEIDPTLLDWISLGWKKIKTQKFHIDRYDEEQEKIRKNIDIQFSEDWWKKQRIKLLSKVNLNEWPLKHETVGKPSKDIINIIDDKKSVDNIICNDLLIRCRIRDFLKVSINNNINNDINNENNDDEYEYKDKDEILVSQSKYSKLCFMKYDLRLPPEEPENHFGIIIIFSDRSIRFYDLYDNKLILLTQGVPGDHINLPGLCAGLIPYEKPNNKNIKNQIIESDDTDDSSNSSSSSSSDSSSNSDTLSIKPGGSMMNLLDNESETEYELKTTIIRCGGTLLKNPTSFIDIFDIEGMIWKRIKQNMHCKRIYTQSIIINAKLIVIGGEIFDNDNDNTIESTMESALTRRISAINENHDNNDDGILRVQKNKSCIEEYDFELKRWDILCILPECIWHHSVCSINKQYNEYEFDKNIENIYNLSTEIFIGGGYSNIKNKYLSQCIIYDMMKDNLINIPSMKYLHSCSSSISFDFNINGLLGNHKNDANKIYVIGGQIMGLSNTSNLSQSITSKQFKCVEVYNLTTKKWEEIDSLNYNHGFYPCVWIQNLLDYKQKRSKEEKERLKRMSKMSKMSKINKNNKKISIDPQPIYTIFVTGNGSNNKTCVEYLDPKTRKWKILTKEIGDINIGQIKSIKNELFKSRKLTPYSIRDDILDRYDKGQKQHNNRYAIIDEL